MSHQHYPPRMLLRLAYVVVILGVVTLPGCQSCNQKPATRTLSWGLLDKSNNTNTQLSSGASFTINSIDTYILTLQVQDPDGIKLMGVTGSTTFKCSYQTTQGGGIGQPVPCPSVTYNLIPTKPPQTINSSGTYQGFVMSDPFTYSSIQCGNYQGHSCSPYSGVQVQGSETSWPGAQTNATLTLNP